MSVVVPLLRLQRISDQDPQCTIRAHNGQAQSMRLVGDKLDILDSLVLGSAIDQIPLILLTLSFVGLLAFVYPYLSVEGTCGNDGAKLGSSPFDLPG